MISVTRRYAVGRRGALSRGSRPHTSHWGLYRWPRTMFTSRAAEPQRIRRRGSSSLLAISSTCFPVRRPRRRPAPTVTSRRPARHRSASVSRVAKHSSRTPWLTLESSRGDHALAGLSLHSFQAPRRPTVPDGIDQWNSRRRADITWAADPLRGPRSTRHRRSTCRRVLRRRHANQGP